MCVHRTRHGIYILAGRCVSYFNKHAIRSSTGEEGVTIAHETLNIGRHSELKAITALLANGWEVAEPTAPETYDLVARVPGGEWQTFQVKTCHTRKDRNGAVVVYAKKSDGTPYMPSECDWLVGINGSDVYLIENRGIGEYWATPNNAAEKWTLLPTAFATEKGEGA